MSIEARQISKRFGTFAALNDVSLHVPTGEMVSLLGPSGSGKTTLLRIIAGLETPDRGTVLFQGEDASDRSVAARKVGFVFQHYALFRHMTVFENVAFGLKVRPRSLRPSKGDIRDRVMELLRLVQMDWLADRHPSQLSGGQRQRVALARALAVEPRVLLLDEPFGALDARVRQELRRWLRRLHDELHVTSVFVTHDQEEALEVADRVVVMNAGRIEQIGTPEEVFHSPASEFVMRFLGHANVFHGRVETGRAVFASMAVDNPDTRRLADGPARVFIRPHDLDIEAHANGEPSFRAQVRFVNAAGPRARIELVDEQGARFDVEIPHGRFHELQIEPGRWVFVIPRRLKVFAGGGDGEEARVRPDDSDLSYVI